MSAREHTGNRIREMRNLRRWNQTDLAKEMRALGFSNWHPTTVARTENGERPLRFEEGFAITQILSVEPRDLLARALPERTTNRLDALAEIERLIQILKADEEDANVPA